MATKKLFVLSVFFQPLPIGIPVFLVQFLPLHAKCRHVNSAVYEHSSAVIFNPVTASHGNNDTSVNQRNIPNQAAPEAIESNNTTSCR